MAAVLAAASYSRGGFSPCLAVSARRVMVPGEITFHLEPGTIYPCWNLTGIGCLRFCLDFPQMAFFSIRDRGGGDVLCCYTPSLNFRLPSNIEIEPELL